MFGTVQAYTEFAEQDYGIRRTTRTLVLSDIHIQFLRRISHHQFLHIIVVVSVSILSRQEIAPISTCTCTVLYVADQHCAASDDRQRPHTISISKKHPIIKELSSSPAKLISPLDYWTCNSAINKDNLWRF